MKRGYTGGFSGSIFTDTGGAVVVNLYTNPQEDVSVGIRHIPMAVPLGTTGGGATRTRSTARTAGTSRWTR